jgi:hypothetical protein
VQLGRRPIETTGKKKVEAIRRAWSKGMGIIGRQCLSVDLF